MLSPPRLYPILDTTTLAARGLAPLEVARIWLEAGVRWMQFRHKDSWSRAVYAEATRIRQLAAAAGATLIVNDRADFAVLLDCGLHVGQDDLPPGEARRLLGPARLLGFSTHNEAQLRAADRESAGLAYLALGPIFGTTSKAHPDPIVGLAQLRQWRSLSRVPLVAIGGITRPTALAVLDAGADSVAVIGDLIPEAPTASALRRRMDEWLTLLPINS